MTAIEFLGEWALRSSILILSGALLLWALRVRDASIRLAAWTAMLFGSLAIPALRVALPQVPSMTIRGVSRPVGTAVVPRDAAPTPVAAASRPGVVRVKQRFDWARAAAAIYILTALALLLRLCVGMAMGLRLLRASHATGRATEGIEVHESDAVAAPITLGIMRPAIVLPGDWREWESTKLEAVLAHERSHVVRFDPALQLVSAIHRALLWHSPLSWYLHLRVVRAAEEASDDAAVAVTGDRPFYAEVLLEFMQRGVRGADGLGVPMARYGRPDQRIDRILDGTSLSRGVTRGSMAAVLALGAPLAYLAAAAQPTPAPHAAPAQTKPMTPRAQSSAAFLRGLGNVTAFYTVAIKSRVDGQLMSVGFKEGDLVHEGQLLATIDPRPYEIQLAQAQAQFAQDESQLAGAALGQQGKAQLEARIEADRAKVESAKLQLVYTRIVSPITGVAGLRLVDPGNIVHASDANGIVVITQLQPMAVLFSIPEDNVREVRARLSEGVSPVVELWDRSEGARIATGRLTAMDNQIDETTGMVRLKAVFDNKNGALFPNQFVIVRLFPDTR